MSILDRLFKSRTQKTEEHSGLKNVAIDKKTGAVTGKFTITVNGKEIEIPIKSSIERLEQECERKADPNSCEREPNADEVKLPVDYDIRIVACDETETIINLQQTAMLRGYNNFVVPRDVLEHALAEYEKRNERNERMGRTAALNNKGIVAEKEGRIDDAIAAYEENIAIGEKSLHAYHRLGVIYRRLKRKDDERRVVLRMIEVFGDSEALQNELKKIDGTYIKPKDIFPEKAEQFKVYGMTMGERFNEIKSRMIEFDFFNSGDESRSEKAFHSPVVKEVWEMQKTFREMIREAEKAESHFDYKTAAKEYERLLAEQYPMPSPYDRLIKIYSRAKLKEDEKRVLKHSITFFTRLRDFQKEYILMLAKKYGKEDFAKDRIQKGQKITYYNGLYELYNPYPITEKWKQRLEKLENLTN